MSDGLNEARAFRVSELISDFRNLQHYISQNQGTPTAEEYYLEGYVLLRHCAAEAEAALATPYNATMTSPAGNTEQEKRQLQAVIVDAAVRRFRCQRAYLRVHAVLRWRQSRQSVLQGQQATAAHVPYLQAVDNQLRTEVAAITDQHVENTLRSQYDTQGKYVAEDPPLATILHVISTQR